jgi:hypothetical protein
VGLCYSYLFRSGGKAESCRQFGDDSQMDIEKKTGRAIAEAVSRRSPTAEARVRARIRPCGIVDDTVALAKFFL